MVLWNAVGLWEFVTMDAGPPTYLPWLVPVVIPALFMVFSVLAFPFRYSVFGAYRRTSHPQEIPVLVKRDLWGRIAWLHATIPFFSWFVYPSGLGVRLLGVGSAFIPVEHIKRVWRAGLLGWTVHHDWPEIRSPLVVPVRAITEKMREVVVARTGRDPGAAGI